MLIKQLKYEWFLSFLQKFEIYISFWYSHHFIFNMDWHLAYKSYLWRYLFLEYNLYFFSTYLNQMSAIIMKIYFILILSRICGDMLILINYRSKNICLNSKQRSHLAFFCWISEFFSMNYDCKTKILIFKEGFLIG